MKTILNAIAVKFRPAGVRQQSAVTIDQKLITSIRRDDVRLWTRRGATAGYAISSACTLEKAA